LLAVWRNPRSDAPYCQQPPFLGAQDYKRWQQCLVCEPFIADNVPHIRSGGAPLKIARLRRHWRICLVILSYFIF